VPAGVEGHRMSVARPAELVVPLDAITEHAGPASVVLNDLIRGCLRDVEIAADVELADALRHAAEGRADQLAHIELGRVIGDDAVHRLDLIEHGAGIPTEEVSEQVLHRSPVLLLAKSQQRSLARIPVRRAGVGGRAVVPLTRPVPGSPNDPFTCDQE